MGGNALKQKNVNHTMNKLSTLAVLWGLSSPALAGPPLDLPPMEEKPPIKQEPPRPKPITERAKEDHGLVEQRLKREESTIENPFVITPHRPNYILPFKYDSSVNQPTPNQVTNVVGDDIKLQDVEVKFQVSLKFPLAFNLFGDNGELWAAYTQQSFWQAYNDDISAPFRENNHEPEIFMQWDFEQEWFGIRPQFVQFGLNHQSNGRSEPLSRSWNRIFADFIFETDDFVLSIKPWYRLPEDDDDDDNPNIERYLGYGEMTGVYVMGDYTLDFMFRNNLRSDNKGAVQLGMTFPLWGKLKGYVQYFNGYGESLITYDKSSQTIGVGIMLTDWL